MRSSPHVTAAAAARVQGLENRVFAPRALVIRQGERGHGMYFLQERDYSASPPNLHTRTRARTRTAAPLPLRRAASRRGHVPAAGLL